MKFVFALFYVFYISNALAVGTETSGGGAGIFCPQNVVGQPPVQLLDIYEGKILHGYTYTESPSSYLSQLQLTQELFRFDFSLFIDFKKILGEIQSEMKFLPEGVSINAPSDLGSDFAVPMPTGCFLAAIGFYQKNGTLMVSKDAFDNLSETQKAAFLVHEAVYKMQRSRPKEWKSSIDARLLVANLFSNQHTENSIKDLSWPMHFSFNEGMVFNPTPNKAALIAGSGMYTGILLTKPLNKVKVKFFNKKSFYEKISFGCIENDWLSDIDFTFKNTDPVDQHFAEWTIPKGCTGLRIHLGSSSQLYRPNEELSTYEIEFDGEKWATGIVPRENSNSGNAFGLTRLYMMFYFNSDL